MNNKGLLWSLELVVSVLILLFLFAFFFEIIALKEIELTEQQKIAKTVEFAQTINQQNTALTLSNINDLDYLKKQSIIKVRFQTEPALETYKGKACNALYQRVYYNLNQLVEVTWGLCNE